MSEIVDPTSDPGWESLALERGSLFTSPPWIRAIVRTYGFDVRASVLRAGETTAAGVPFAQIEDVMGARVVSLPFSDYCDPMLNGDGSWERLAEPLFEPGWPVAMRCLREPGIGADPRLAETGRAFWHAIDVRDDAEAMWSDLSGSARRNIRAAQRQGVRVELRRDRVAVDDFYRLHSDLRRRKYRLLAQPPAFFENIWREFSPTGDIVVSLAMLDGEAIASMVLLTWGDTLYYKFGASVAEGLSVRPNDLLFWQAMQYASQRGLARVDLGLSDADQEGLVRFKRKFASEERTLHLLKHVPVEHVDARRDEIGRLLGSLTDLLTQDGVPESVTRRAGEQLYRYFT